MKKNGRLVLLFGSFLFMYLYLTFLIPGFRIKLEAPTGIYILESLKSIAGFKTLLSTLFAALVTGFVMKRKRALEVALLLLRESKKRYNIDIMFGFSKKETYTDREITIVCEQKFGKERSYGISKTMVFFIYLYQTRTCVGYIDLRVGESEYLYYMGHIGYRIDPPYRHHGYAAKAVKLILNQCYKEDLKKVIITCSPENIASYKTIEKSGGKLLEIVDVPEWHELFERGETRKCIFEIEL